MRCLLVTQPHMGMLSFVASDRCDTLGVSGLAETPCDQRFLFVNWGGPEDVRSRPRVLEVW